jgi:predicted NBD/HSP70 family sugar kinase
MLSSRTLFSPVSTAMDAAHAAYSVTLEVLDQMGHHLRIGIASWVNALDPDPLVLGGVLSPSGEFLLPSVDHDIQRRTLPWNEYRPNQALKRAKAPQPSHSRVNH